MPKKDLLEQVREALKDRRGEFRRVSEESGVPYHTITKISNGATPNPRWETVANLSKYLLS